jgi:hypothetical protein
MIATLVVGATLAATMTPSAFAGGGKKVKQDKYIRGTTRQDGSKKGTRDTYNKGAQDNGTRDSGNGGGGIGNENGNTVTALAAKNKGFASGFDTSVDQEAQNVICTHPSNNATCTQEGAVVVATPTPRESCEQCFTNSIQEQGQINSIINFINAQVPSVTSLADLCESLQNGTVSGDLLGDALRDAGVSDLTASEIFACLERTLGIVFD